MTRLPRDIRGTDLVQRLSRIGSTHTRTQGSHAVCTATQRGVLSVLIPLHRNLAVGTLHSVVRKLATYLDKTSDEVIALLEL